MKVSTVEELRDFIEDFLKEKGVKARVILFGSRARGEHSEHSDVDIAIESDEELSWVITELRGLFEESDLPQKVDVIDFKRAPESLREEIEREGKVWIDLSRTIEDRNLTVHTYREEVAEEIVSRMEEHIQLLRKLLGLFRES